MHHGMAYALAWRRPRCWPRPVVCQQSHLHGMLQPQTEHRPPSSSGDHRCPRMHHESDDHVPVPRPRSTPALRMSACTGLLTNPRFKTGLRIGYSEDPEVTVVEPGTMHMSIPKLKQ